MPINERDEQESSGRRMLRNLLRGAGVGGIGVGAGAAAANAVLRPDTSVVSALKSLRDRFRTSVNASDKVQAYLGMGDHLNDRVVGDNTVTDVLHWMRNPENPLRPTIARNVPGFTRNWDEPFFVGDEMMRMTEGNVMPAEVHNRPLSDHYRAFSAGPASGLEQMFWENTKRLPSGEIPGHEALKLKLQASHEGAGGTGSIFEAPREQQQAVVKSYLESDPDGQVLADKLVPGASVGAENYPDLAQAVALPLQVAENWAVPAVAGAGLLGASYLLGKKKMKKTSSRIDTGDMLMTPAVKLAMFKAANPPVAPAQPNLIERTYNDVKGGVNNYINGQVAQHAWDNNTPLRYGVYGAGIGAGAGLLGGLFSRKKDKWKAIMDGLSTGAAGGLVGGAVGLGKDVVDRNFPNKYESTAPSGTTVARNDKDEIVLTKAPAVNNPILSVVNAAADTAFPGNAKTRDMRSAAYGLAGEAASKLRNIDPKHPGLGGLEALSLPQGEINSPTYVATFRDLVRRNLADPKLSPDVKAVYQQLSSDSGNLMQAVSDDSSTVNPYLPAHAAAAAATAVAASKDHTNKTTKGVDNTQRFVSEAVGPQNVAGSTPATLGRPEALQEIAKNPAALTELTDRVWRAYSNAGQGASAPSAADITSHLEQGKLPPLPHGVNVDALTSPSLSAVSPMTPGQYDANNMGRGGSYGWLKRRLIPTSTGAESRVPILGQTSTGRTIARGGALQAALLGMHALTDATRNGLNTGSQQKLVVDPATGTAKLVPYAGN